MVAFTENKVGCQNNQAIRTVEKFYCLSDDDF